MSRLTASIHSWLRDPRLREFLVWCLPALIAGLALRGILMSQLPYAVFHDDTSDFLVTPDMLFKEHELDLHAKKTFLVPAIFTIPFLLRVPALVAIPLFQHFVGLLLVLLVGLLCRLWFRHWRVFIVPLTLITAVNPFLLWYEHTLMAETLFVFCTVLVAVAGTLYTMYRTRGWLIAFCVSLVLEAGARPEGKLLFGFGLFLLVLLHTREWRAMWPRFAAMFVIAIVTHFQTKTAQGGLLLYTSVVRLTPTELKVAPGFEPYIAPIRSELQKLWDQRPQFPKVKDRRAIADAVKKYLEDRAQGKAKFGHREVNEFCMKLAAETCRKNFFNLPEHIYYKFRHVANEAPSGLLDYTWLFERQRAAYHGDIEQNLRLAKGLTGKKLTSEAELNSFVDSKYKEIGWFNQFVDSWLGCTNHFRLRDSTYNENALPIIQPGVPYYFLLSAAGLIAVMLLRGRLQPFHIAWGLTLLGFFYVIILTANVRPRFRFVFEPFWYLYIALLIESVWLAIVRLVPRR